MEKVYEDTKKFWSENPCGSMHMPDIYKQEDKRSYFKSFDNYFWNMYPYLIPFMNYKQMQGKTVLEIGIGSGTTLGRSCRYAKKVYGVDLSDGTIELNQQRKRLYKLENLELINCSATQLPFADESIDIVVSIGCIHHIPDAEKVFQEIYRVLKKDGTFKGMVYYRDSYRIKYYIPKEMKYNYKWRGYTREKVINEIYDGKGNPYIKLYSKKELSKCLRGEYSKVKFSVQNFQPEELREHNVILQALLPDKLSRNFYLKTIGRILGLDLYFIAIK